MLLTFTEKERLFLLDRLEKPDEILKFIDWHSSYMVDEAIYRLKNGLETGLEIEKDSVLADILRNCFERSTYLVGFKTNGAPKEWLIKLKDKISLVCSGQLEYS